MERRVRVFENEKYQLLGCRLWGVSQFVIKGDVKHIFFLFSDQSKDLLPGTDISQVKSWIHLLICSNWIFIFKYKCSCWEIYRLRQAVSSQIHEIRTKYFLFGSKICVWVNYLYAHISEINPDIPMHKISTFVVEILRGGSDCSWLFLLFGLAQMAIDLSSPPCPEIKHAPVQHFIQ